MRVYHEQGERHLLRTEDGADAHQNRGQRTSPISAPCCLKGFLGALDYAVDPRDICPVSGAAGYHRGGYPTCCPAWPHLTRLTGRWWEKSAALIEELKLTEENLVIVMEKETKSPPLLGSAGAYPGGRSTISLYCRWAAVWRPWWSSPAYGVYISFQDQPGEEMDLCGAALLSEALKSPEFLGQMLVTVKFTAGVVAGHFFFGMILALLLNRNFRGRSVFASSFCSHGCSRTVWWPCCSSGILNRLYGS